MVADRLLGRTASVLYGGILIASGHFSLAFPSLPFFYSGLALIVIGTGLLKGNVCRHRRPLYAPGDTRRDAGFSIFYMGINLGAFIGRSCAGYLGQRVNWHVGFAMAGFGMVARRHPVRRSAGRHLPEAGLQPAPAKSPADAARLRNRARWAGITSLAAIAGFAFSSYTGALPIGAKQVADFAGYVLLFAVVGVFAWLFLAGEWTPQERRRLLAITVLFFAAGLFWSEFEQAGSTLNLFGDRATRTSNLRL